MWCLIFVASLAISCNCKDENSILAEDQKSNLPFEEENQNQLWSRNTLVAESNSIALQDKILKAASNIGNAPNIEKLIMRMETFSRKFPSELLKDRSIRPMSTKFKKSYDALLTQTKPILRTAKNLEKMGKKKSQKQLDAFAVKLRTLNKHIERFTKSVNDESKKQRNRNLKIMNSNRNDVTMVENAKRCINIADSFAACIQWIQSIPSNINCFIFGKCETNNEDQEEDDGENGDDDDGDDDDDDDDDDGGDDDDGNDDDADYEGEGDDEQSPDDDTTE